ncbi:UNVERIFIED_CONTAM: NADPH:adrenodoxin oxidoreductase, mitochondrial [Sesamum radiatum]|uniref:NADPH:adrenodoxin oxidoreductase, mitochondrial n=1 Tax=Sesamum radiatum TaxID=300843 RepID=A0AAW2RXL4_SESRA
MRRFTTHPSAPLRICVVGSGPAGFYTAEKILKAHEKVEVDIIDRLPTPFGLVRSGVAPDHPETKLACISDDVAKGVLTSNSPKPGRDGLLQLLDSRNTVVVNFDAWEKIDAEEKRRGNLKNKPREKLTTWEELLKVVRILSPSAVDKKEQFSLENDCPKPNRYILEELQAELQTEYIQIFILVQGFDHVLALFQIHGFAHDNCNDGSNFDQGGSKFLARFEAKLNSLTATSIPYDRPDERVVKTGIHSSSWLARSGKRTAGNPRSLDVTSVGVGQKTKPGMSRIALPKKSYLVSREQYIALLIRELQSSLLNIL